MHLQLKDQIMINAPAQKVWRVLAHEFGTVGQWASSIPESQAVRDIPAPAGAAVSGRMCATAVPGFGDVRETFTYYDEQSMRFGYEPTEGRPWFIKHAENHWLVRSLEPETSLVKSRAELDLGLFIGVFLAPLLKFFMGRVGTQFFEELKYYVEHDQPHPAQAESATKALEGIHTFVAVRAFPNSAYCGDLCELKGLLCVDRSVDLNLQHMLARIVGAGGNRAK